MKTGKFVTIEGCEGAGKSTQLKLIADYCVKNGIDAIFTREPGGTPISEQIRKIILDADNMEMDDVTELLLYNAARRQHIFEKILPAINSGKLVFCDRFIDSTMAYQGYARGLNRSLINRLNELTLADFKIDLTIFINIDPESGFKRKGGNGSDRLEQENLSFHKSVYSGYCEIASSESERVVNINAYGTKQQTHCNIIKALKEHNIL